MALETTIGGDGTLFIGEDKILRFECVDDEELPIDIGSWTMVFDVRKKDTSLDPAILSITPTLIGSYSATRALNTQRAIVAITDDQMNLFKAKTYRWSWKRTNGGFETVLGYGPFTPQKATAP